MMNQRVREPIVVGLDHTPAGSAALRWAADEAHRQGARLMAVHVYDRAARADLALVVDHDEERSRERIAAHLQLVDALGPAAAHLGVALSQQDGDVATRLAASAQDAVLLVIGRPSTSSGQDLLRQLSSTCTCPVVVVDEDGTGHDASELVAEESTV